MASLEQLAQSLAASSREEAGLLGTNCKRSDAGARSEWGGAIVPWVASLVAHLGLLLLAAFITWGVARNAEEEDSVLIVADFNALNYEPLQDFDHPSAAERPVQLDLPSPAQLDAILKQRLEEARGPALESLAAGSAGAGQSVWDALPADGGSSASFLGLSATNANKIVYLIDATGSMIAHLQIVLQELSRSLDKLSEQQSFAVIFFQSDRAIEVPPGRLTAARSAAKTRAIEWSRQNIVPAGTTNPLPAIERALALKPDVIFLLSHGLSESGMFEVDQKQLLAKLNEKNPIDRLTGRRTVQINCIQFIKNDPLGTMEKIGREHGGANGFRFVDRAQLGL